MTSRSHVFDGDCSQVSTARHWLLDQLGGRDHPAAWEVELLGSELITNAVRHTASGRPGGTVKVSVDLGEGWVWIGVTDQGAAVEPRIAAPGTSGLGGRGLELVDQTARSWGHEPTAEGRLVWCILATEDR